MNNTNVRFSLIADIQLSQPARFVPEAGITPITTYTHTRSRQCICVEDAQALTDRQLRRSEWSLSWPFRIPPRITLKRV